MWTRQNEVNKQWKNTNKKYKKRKRDNGGFGMVGAGMKTKTDKVGIGNETLNGARTGI